MTNQYKKIIAVLEQYGWVDPRYCVRAVPMITTKLSTRIGEMERKVWLETGDPFLFERKRLDDGSGFTRYYATPAMVKTLKNVFKCDQS